MRVAITDCEVFLTGEDFADFVDTAGYGIAYWAVAPCYVDTEAGTYTVRFYGTADDPQDYSDDDDDISEVVVTKAALEAAIARVIKDYPSRAKHFTAYVYDAEDADMVIQTAIFGRVIFG